MVWPLPGCPTGEPGDKGLGPGPMSQRWEGKRTAVNCLDSGFLVSTLNDFHSAPEVRAVPIAFFASLLSVPLLLARASPLGCTVMESSPMVISQPLHPRDGQAQGLARGTLQEDMS